METGSQESSASPVRGVDITDFATTATKKERIRKIDMKTKELKKLEGMEEITNFFQVIPSANDE
jgi:hypothetical protein